MRRVRKAVIPAAGLGTRFLPATKAQPKEMLPLVDKPVIQYVVEEAVASGIEDLLIITGRGKRAIEDHFDRSVELEHYLAGAGAGAAGGGRTVLNRVRDLTNLVDIYFVRQKEPLGLGHAILTGRRHIGDEPFAVLLGDEVFGGDIPCLKQLITCYEESSARAVIAVREVAPSQVSRYGIVAGESLGEDRLLLRGLVEKPSPAESPSNLAVMGRYVLPPEIFDLLAETPPGRGGEIQLTDALCVLAGRGGVWGEKVSGRRFDVGDVIGYLTATVEMALSRPDLSEAFEEILTAILKAHPRPSPAQPAAQGPAGPLGLRNPQKSD